MASLMHDIGKIVRRSGYSNSNHSDAGAEYILHEDIKMPYRDEIIQVMRHHHAKQMSEDDFGHDHMAYLIYEADNIASAIDRRKIQSQIKGNEMASLDSVFNVLNENKGNQGLVHLPKVNPTVDIDIPGYYSKVLTQGEYAEILERIKKHFMAMDFETEDEDTILSVFESLLRNVPSASYVDVPDISLYDHLKMTGAVATCIFEYAQSQGIKDYRKAFFINSDQFRNDKAFLLASGDFSGIQDFIYTIVSKNAMKALRGRSLYLELLSENIIDEILENLELSRANLLYSGGGHFYLLLPNTRRSNELLSHLNDSVNEWFLSRFHINLYLSMGWTACSAHDLGNDLNQVVKRHNLMGEVYRAASVKVSEQKISRYTEGQLTDLFDPDSQVNLIESFLRECSVCKRSTKMAEDETVCEECKNLIELGRKTALLDANQEDALIVVYHDLPESLHEDLEVPSADGSSNFLRILNKSKYIEELKSNAPIKRAYAINKPLVGEHLVKNLWVGNYNVKSNGKYGLIEFDEMIQRSEGIERLAVLRADVDDLGNTFVEGFSHGQGEGQYQYASLSRSAVLSRKLSEFFKQDINKIAGMTQKDYAYSGYFAHPGDAKEGRDLSIVYSGGDDIFVIGTWNDVIEFSIDLRKNFEAFTQGKLSFSAGIGFFHNKYPIHQMAKITGKLEDASKSVKGKDSITLFSLGEVYSQDETSGYDNRYTFKWDEFIQKVMDEKYQALSRWFGDGDHGLEVGKSMLYKIFNLVGNRITHPDERIAIGRLAYLIGRLGTRVNKKNTGQVANYSELKDKLYEWTKDFEEARSLYAALQMMIYTMRGD